MRWITLILLITSCSEKEQDIVFNEQDSVLMKSQARTEAMSNVLVKVDTIIHKQEQRIENKLESLKVELDNNKAIQNKTKVIYIHDTVMIKEKTNFWGRKRISVDSSVSIDSLEYN